LFIGWRKTSCLNWFITGRLQIMHCINKICHRKDDLICFSNLFLALGVIQQGRNYNLRFKMDGYFRNVIINSLNLPDTRAISQKSYPYQPNRLSSPLIFGVEAICLQKLVHLTYKLCLKEFFLPWNYNHIL